MEQANQVASEVDAIATATARPTTSSSLSPNGDEALPRDRHARFGFEFDSDTLRVLVVDDDPDDLLLMREALESSNLDLEIETVMDPMAARSRIADGAHDVFLVDWRLGLVSGIDLVAEFSDDASGPMIVVTGLGGSEVDRRAEAAGAFDYVRKDGLVPAVLARTIRYAVRAWRDRSRFRDMLDQAPVGLFRTRPDGHIVEANPTLAEIFGCADPADLTQRTALELYADPEDRAAVMSALRSGSNIDDRELRMERIDGTEIWVSVRMRGMFANGELVELYGTVRDVTDQRRLEAQRRLQASMITQAQHAVGAMDMQGVVVDWNPAAERKFGWTRDEVLGKRRMELGIFDDEELARAAFAELMETGRWEGEMRMRRRDGTVFPGLTSYSIVHDERNEPLAIVATTFDLSEIRRAEQLATEHKAMADSVMNSVRFPTAILDSEGCITATNKAWSQVALAGDLEPSDVGAGVNYLEVCEESAEADAVVIGRGIRSVLARETDHFSAEYGLEIDGLQRWYRIEVATPDSPSLGAVVIHIDITALRRATEEATELAESRRNLLASVSHELRTPLTAILGFASVSQHASDAERAQFVDEIQAQATDMAGIIEDLLVAARSERGDVTIAPRTLDLGDEVQRTVEAISNRAGKTITINTNDVTPCHADPLRLRQIIRNLVTNAVRYGGDNITIETRSNGNRSRLAVTDDGPGIDPDRLERIFHPYENAHPHEGTPDSLGLGLAVSRNLAELMDGAITYTRSNDRTTFELDLPTTAC